MYFFMAVIALVGWCALVLQLYIIITNNIANGTSVVDGIIKFFSFFTVLTNILLSLSLTAVLISPSSGVGKFFSRISVQSAIVVYISIVSIVYNIILRQLWDPQGLQLIADVLLHQVIPLIYVFYWVAFIPKGTLVWKFPFRLLIYPLIYLVYIVVRGAATGHYPYPFMDVTQIGTEKMLWNAFFIMIAFVGIGYLLVATDASMKRKADKRSRPQRSIK